MEDPSNTAKYSPHQNTGFTKFRPVPKYWRRSLYSLNEDKAWTGIPIQVSNSVKTQLVQNQLKLINKEESGHHKVPGLSTQTPGWNFSHIPDPLHPPGGFPPFK
ncbi:hypothetical protein O181_017554 [Austropuccinia psidii MF-1]|uniref:Uncharacterized protein n=1 Tax=Austropuccinia psidii MF-1 TaxID=1389203 RepID=A0A9Q3C3M4_9BASI|nr:hypothetical protein [Austropuccinia psidii MF-1]